MKTPLQPVSSLTSFPGETLQINLVGPLQSPLYKYALTAIDVFTKYLFAVPLTNVRADTIARELTSIFFRHSYLQKTILSDLGTSFVSDLLHKLTQLLKFKLEHASLKHPQTVGVVERSHSALKSILKLNTNEQWNDWFKYLQLATFIHYTSYHSAIGCSPTVLFHGREPIKPLDRRFNNSLIERFSPKSEYVFAIRDALRKKFGDTKLKLTEMCNKYRAYYDYKAEAKLLAPFSYCLLVNPKLMNQSDFASKSLPIWLPLYRVEKSLTNSNYIIRKVGTSYTQLVHRIRLRPVTPQSRVDDIPVINCENFQRDPSIGFFRGEPALFDESLPSLLDPPPTGLTTITVEEDSPPVTVSLHFAVAPAPATAAVAAGAAPVAAVSDPIVVPEPTDPTKPEVIPPVASGMPRSPTLHCDHNVSNDNSDYSLRENSIYFPLPPALEQPERQSSSEELSNTYDLRPRLPPRDYHKQAAQNKIPPKVRCNPVKAPDSSSAQLTPLEKRAVILDSCNRTRMIQGTSQDSTTTILLTQPPHFTHDTHSSPPGY